MKNTCKKCGGPARLGFTLCISCLRGDCARVTTSKASPVKPKPAPIVAAVVKAPVTPPVDEEAEASATVARSNALLEKYGPNHPPANH